MTAVSRWNRWDEDRRAGSLVWGEKFLRFSGGTSDNSLSHSPATPRASCPAPSSCAPTSFLPCFFQTQLPIFLSWFFHHPFSSSEELEQRSKRRRLHMSLFSCQVCCLWIVSGERRDGSKNISTIHLSRRYACCSIPPFFHLLLCEKSRERTYPNRTNPGPEAINLTLVRLDDPWVRVRLISSGFVENDPLARFPHSVQRLAVDPDDS